MTETLWEGLGGETTMWKVVDDFVNRSIKDPKINYRRSGKYFHDEMKIARTKKGVFDFLSSALGGPYPYRGPRLSEIQRKMEITDTTFDLFTSHFQSALEKQAISPVLIQVVMGMVEHTRSMVVGDSVHRVL